MRNLIFIIFWLFTLTTHAQLDHESGGTKIINNLSWYEIKAKAIKEHKFILIDCNSTWCGPCKFLENRIFPLDTIGKLLNSKFLVVSVQFDTSMNDNDFVKSWYSTAQRFKVDYGVTLFPTEIILDENAKPITKFCGVNTDDGISYIYDRIEESFQPQYQYFNLKKSAQSLNNLPSIDLRNLAKSSFNAGELAEFNFYRDIYFKSLSKENFYSKENLEFIVDNLLSTKDSLFNLVLDNRKKIDSIVGAPIATERLAGLIYFDNLKWNKIFNQAGNISLGHYVYVEEPNWDNISRSISRKYAELNSEIMFIAKLDFYNLEHLGDKYFDLVLSNEKISKNIELIFTKNQFFYFLNKVLAEKSSDKFWLLKCKNWLNNIDGVSENKKQRYLNAINVRLDNLSIAK